jgi:hypothetical protein
MPRYTINGKKIRTDKILTDAEIDEIGKIEAGAPPAPPELEAPAPPAAAAPPTTSSGRPAPTTTLDTLGDMIKGGASRVGDVIKGGVDFMGQVKENTPGGLPGTLYPPTLMVGTGKTLLDMGKGAVSSFVDNAETRAQSALDQLDLLKNQPGGPPSLPEFLTSPELKESMRQVTHTVVPEVETQEVIPGSGGAEFPTGRALGEKAVDLTLANPPVQTASTALGALKPSLLADRAAAKLRSVAGLQDASEHLAKLETPHPLNRLEPHELGSAVGAQEEQAFRLRKQQGNTLYKALDEFPVGVSVRDLLDEDMNLLLPKGIDLPPEIKKAIDAVRREKKAVDAANGKLKPGEVAGTEALDMAMSKLDDLPFTAAHELRKNISDRIRASDPRNPSPDLPDLLAARKAVQAEMEAAAQKLSPDEYAAWKGAEEFWKREVAENHYRGPGKAVYRKRVAGDPQKMGKTIEPFAPQDVDAVHRTLIPEGEWVTPAAKKAGQKAFDSLVEQRIRTELGALNAGDTIDLTKAGKAIDMRVGRAAWDRMKQLASPELSTRMNSLENVARAYEKIGASTELGTEAAALELMGKASRRGGLTRPFSLYKELKPEILKWALEHPARTEVLTQGLQTASAGLEAQQLAARNVGNILRLYDIDKGRPPEMPNLLRKVSGQ